MSAQYLQHKGLESDNNLAQTVLIIVWPRNTETFPVYLILKALIILSSAEMFKIL